MKVSSSSSSLSIRRKPSSTVAFVALVVSVVMIELKFVSVSAHPTTQQETGGRKLEQNLLECLDNETGTVDPSIDYFPEKVQPTVSQYWDIEYFNTYKVVTNKYNNATYLLYQCGTTIPTTQEYNATIAIPISKVSVTWVNTISFLEQLNKVDSVVAYTNDVSLIGSPCLKEAIESRSVYVVQNRSQLDEYISTNFVVSALLNPDDVVSFNGPWDTNFPFDSNIITSTENELTNAAIFEWIKFYSAFFNLEDVANQAFEAAQDRSECITKGATRTTSDGTKPVVLWGYYSDYCGGWDLAHCPNYYCEFAEACSATLISVPYGTGSVNATEKCGAMYMTVQEVIDAGGADAEYWIFPADNWDATYEQFGTELDSFKSVQNKNVFDVQGSGLNAWFEQRYAEYYNVQQDFCSAIGTTSGLTTRGWFRNTLKKVPVGGLDDTCEDINKTAILPYEYTCDLVVDMDSNVENNDTKNSSGSSDDAGTDSAGTLTSNVVAFTSTVFSTIFVASMLFA